MNDTKAALILGSGPCGQRASELLAGAGIDVTLASRNGRDASSSSEARVLENAVVKSCRGSAGAFEVSLEADGRVVDRSAGAIVVAEEDVRESNFSHYGLEASDHVVALSGLAEILARTGSEGHASDALSDVEKAVFITGVGRESNPVIAGEMLSAALDLQEGRGVQTYVLTRNLKVAANGLEALHQKAKSAGTVFIKFEGADPVIQQDPDGRARIEFQDEVLRRPFRLSPDLCVVDETISPSPGLEHLADVLELARDRAGFIQSDNVHRNPVFSNRVGVFAAGPSRCVQSRADHLVDAENAALAVIGLLSGAVGGAVNTAEIDAGHCVRCLTCVRVCHYRAIRLNTRPLVAADACEGCGVCAAECPGLAISINGLGPDLLADQDDWEDLTSEDGVFDPRIIAFCCARSGIQAGELAAAMNHPTPPGLRVVATPCAGGVSMEHILSAFKKRADGVLVLTCHEGNCHSERGNILARNRVEHITGLFPQIGVDKERLAIRTLASNMGKEFADAVNEFEASIKELGPMRLYGK